jgi:excisionase family DNA binding protein
MFRGGNRPISTMRRYSTVEVAEKLGIRQPNLQRLIAKGKIPFPPMAKIGRLAIRLWSDADIAKTRKALKVPRGKEKHDTRKKR